MGEGTSDLSSRISKTVSNLFAVALAVVTTLVLVVGFYDYYEKDNDFRKCEMTVMYQFPHFVRIPLKNGNDEKYPMYGLYIYAEGHLVEAARKQLYTGIPVLFLPGNAGSYKQARSIASVALYKAVDTYAPFHFDVFSIDFNEEMSAIYGYVLHRQLDYTRLALDRIVSLYEEFHRVVIVGHSMGGIVAKTVNVDEIKSHLIFTLAAPHAHPVLILDPEFDVFYYQSQINSTMLEEEQKVTVVSVAGGKSDLVVHDKLTQSPLMNFHTSTPWVPSVWVSCDHVNILWCNQFVKVIVRILFDLVVDRDPNHRGPNGYARITDDSERINSVLNYHLFKRSSGKSLLEAFPKDAITKPPKAAWEEILVPFYCKAESYQVTYVMFPMVSIREKLQGDHEDNYVTVITSTQKPKSWIFGCKEQDVANGVRYCSKLENLTPLGEILPHKRRAVHLDFGSIKKFSHLVVKTLGSDKRFCIHVDVSSTKIKPLPTSVTIENKAFLNYSVNHLTKRFTVWRLDAQAKGNKCNISKALAVFKHENFGIGRLINNETLFIRFTSWSSKDAHVLLYLDPKCKYDLSFRVAYIETAGQLFRTYVWLLPSYITSIILLSLFFQNNYEEWQNFHVLLLKNAFNFTFIPGVTVGVMLTFIPTDYLKIMDKSEVSLFLPLLCYLVSYTLVFMLTAVGWYCLIGSGNALHSVLLKFLYKKLGKIPDKVADYALNVTFARFPIIISVLLISLSTATCGGVGILAGFLIYVIKIFKMYEDILDDLVRGKIKDLKEGLTPLYFHQVIASLWFVIAALNLPSVIHWVRNFGYGQFTQWDMSMYVSLMLTPVVAILWQDFVPKYNEKIWMIQRYVSYSNGILIVLWGTHRLYIISFFITMYLITLAFTQFLSNLIELVNKSQSAIEGAGNGDHGSPPDEDDKQQSRRVTKDEREEKKKK